MAAITKRTILNSRIEKVWRFITNPDNFSKYIYGYERGQIISQNKVGLKAHYEWYGKLGPFKLRSNERIVKWHEKKLVAYMGSLFGIEFNSKMNVKKFKNKTQLTISIKYKVPLYLGSKITDVAIIRQIIRFYIKKSLGNLKAIFNK